MNSMGSPVHFGTGIDAATAAEVAAKEFAVAEAARALQDAKDYTDQKSSIATQSEAESGTENTKLMTPLRVKQSIDENGGGGGSPFNQDGDLIMPENGGIVFDRNDTSIRVGMGFHIRSGEGISLEAVDLNDSTQSGTFIFGAQGDGSEAGMEILKNGVEVGGVWNGFYADKDNISFESPSGHMTTVVVGDGSADHTVTLPSASGTLALNNQPGVGIVAASVSLSDPENNTDKTGGISLGFTGSQQGVLFNGAADGSYYLTHDELSGQDYTISLPSASGTLAIGNQSLNTTDSPTFHALTINDGDAGNNTITFEGFSISGYDNGAGFGPGGVSGYYDNDHGNSFSLNGSGVSFKIGDDNDSEVPTSHYGHGLIEYTTTSAGTKSFTLPSASGTLALLSDINNHDSISVTDGGSISVTGVDNQAVTIQDGGISGSDGSDGGFAISSNSAGGGYETNNGSASWNINAYGTSFATGDESGVSSYYGHGVIQYNPDIANSSQPITYTLPSKGGSLAVRDDLYQPIYHWVNIVVDYAGAVDLYLPDSGYYIGDASGYFSRDYDFVNNSGYKVADGLIQEWSNGDFAQSWQLNVGIPAFDEEGNAVTAFIHGTFGTSEISGVIKPLGVTANSGTSPYLARQDHVHPLPTASQVGAVPSDQSSAFAGLWIARSGVPTTQTPQLNASGKWGIFKNTLTTGSGAGAVRLYVNDGGTLRYLQFT